MLNINDIGLQDRCAASTTFSAVASGLTPALSPNSVNRGCERVGTVRSTAQSSPGDRTTTLVAGPRNDLNFQAEARQEEMNSFSSFDLSKTEDRLKCDAHESVAVYRHILLRDTAGTKAVVRDQDNTAYEWARSLDASTATPPLHGPPESIGTARGAHVRITGNDHEGDIAPRYRPRNEPARQEFPTTPMTDRSHAIRIGKSAHESDSRSAGDGQMTNASACSSTLSSDTQLRITSAITAVSWAVLRTGKHESLVDQHIHGLAIQTTLGVQRMIVPCTGPPSVDEHEPERRQSSRRCTSGENMGRQLFRNGHWASTVPIAPSNYSLDGKIPPQSLECLRQHTLRGGSGAEGGWIIVSAEDAKRAKKRMLDQAKQNEALQVLIEKHKRERVMIYDAIMREASNREEERVKQMKQTFDRAQTAMRAEVDRELHKINDLYHGRCRDYAQMVSDGYEEDITKAAAELREKWAKEKKKISQLIHEEGAEDRQVAVVARALATQLEAERNHELTVIREEVYADVKADFLSREVVLRDSLHSQHQADLDGQLLLAEIRHQKEIDELRGALTHQQLQSVTSPKETVGNLRSRAARGEGKSRAFGIGSKSPPPATYSPQTHRLAPRKMPACVENKTACGLDLDRELETVPMRQRTFSAKLPSFKTPAQNKGTRDRHVKRADVTRRTVSGTTVDRCPPGENSQDEVVRTRCGRDDDGEDRSITCALTLSPTRSDRGKVVSLSTEGENEAPAGGFTTRLRPVKKAKRLFSVPR